MTSLTPTYNKLPYPYSLDFSRGIQNIHPSPWVKHYASLYKHFSLIKCHIIIGIKVASVYEEE